MYPAPFPGRRLRRFFTYHAAPPHDIERLSLFTYRVTFVAHSTTLLLSFQPQSHYAVFRHALLFRA